jgi:hypothetical protein
MTTPRKGFRVFVTQFPEVTWARMVEEAEATGQAVSGLLAEVMRERYGIPLSQIPPPGRPGRKPNPPARRTRKPKP